MAFITACGTAATSTSAGGQQLVAFDAGVPIGLVWATLGHWVSVNPLQQLAVKTRWALGGGAGVGHAFAFETGLSTVAGDVVAGVVFTGAGVRVATLPGVTGNLLASVGSADTLSVAHFAGIAHTEGLTPGVAGVFVAVSHAVF